LRKLIQLFGFWYGCLGALCCAAWYASAVLGNPALPSFNWLLAFFILHCCAATFTFQPHMRPPWEPLFSLSPGRIRLAKTLFSLATLNFIVCFGLFLVAGKLGDRALEEKAVSLILTSFLFQNTVYIAVHWAFRPANLFPGAFIEALSNPLGSFLGLISPRFRKH
jgi:hypothetical protein